MNKELALNIYGELKERKGKYGQEWTNEYNTENCIKKYHEDIIDMCKYCEENGLNGLHSYFNDDLEDYRENEDDDQYILMDRQSGEIVQVLEKKIQDIILA